jgi:hypothetical protein
MVVISSEHNAPTSVVSSSPPQGSHKAPLHPVPKSAAEDRSRSFARSLTRPSTVQERSWSPGHRSPQDRLSPPLASRRTGGQSTAVLAFSRQLDETHPPRFDGMVSPAKPVFIRKPDSRLRERAAALVAAASSGNMDALAELAQGLGASSLTLRAALVGTAPAAPADTESPPPLEIHAERSFTAPIDDAWRLRAREWEARALAANQQLARLHEAATIAACTGAPYAAGQLAASMIPVSHDGAEAVPLSSLPQAQSAMSSSAALADAFGTALETLESNLTRLTGSSHTNAEHVSWMEAQRLLQDISARTLAPLRRIRARALGAHKVIEATMPRPTASLPPVDPGQLAEAADSATRLASTLHLPVPAWANPSGARPLATSPAMTVSSPTEWAPLSSPALDRARTSLRKKRS